MGCGASADGEKNDGPIVDGRWFRVPRRLTTVVDYVPEKGLVELFKLLQNGGGGVVLAANYSQRLRAGMRVRMLDRIPVSTKDTILSAMRTLSESKDRNNDAVMVEADLATGLSMTEQQTIGQIWKDEKAKGAAMHTVFSIGVRDVGGDSDVIRVIDYIASIVDERKLAVEDVVYVLAHIRGGDEARARMLFAAIDEDGSGTLEHEELLAAVNAMFHAAAQTSAFQLNRLIDEIQEKMDVNGDGLIDVDEFVSAQDFLSTRLSRLAAQQRGGDTGLHDAVRLCQIDRVKGLLKEGANPDAENDAGLTPLEVGLTGDDTVHIAIIKALKGKTKVTLPRYTQGLLRRATKWDGDWRVRESWAELEAVFRDSGMQTEWGEEKAQRCGKTCLVAAVLINEERLKLVFADGKSLFWFPFKAVYRQKRQSAGEELRAPSSAQTISTTERSMDRHPTDNPPPSSVENKLLDPRMDTTNSPPRSPKASKVTETISPILPPSSPIKPKA